MKTVAITQSSYIPWKGFFDILHRADECIIYDSMQFTKRDWRSRNRIKSDKGSVWLSIPVQTKGRYHQQIREARVADADWARKHWLGIRGSYAKAPYFATYGRLIEGLYEQAAQLHSLSEINLLFIRAFCELLGIECRLRPDSDFELVSGKSERLLDICRQTGADVYLSGPSAKDYLDCGLFDRAGIEVRWMDYGAYPTYPQLHPPFEHAVSIIDPLLHLGETAISAIDPELRHQASV